MSGLGRAFLAVIFLAVSSSLCSAQSVCAPALVTAKSSVAPIVVPVFIDDGTISSEITIVNALLQNVSGTLVLRSTHGDILLTQKLNLTSHEKKVLTLRSLLNSAKTFVGVGSISLQQDQA